ncbi:MAG TPA: hypothetical protein VG675_18150 [Bryobacteraceae bacterium]|nr:hypothetical protein [Bryobacteraceae bacterium]
MFRFFTAILLACVLHAQAPTPTAPAAPSPPATDPLGRGTPQESVFHFLEACHARDYHKAMRYLDLRSMSTQERAREGPELAKQLEDLLDDTPFDITALSRDPFGSQGGRHEDLETLKTGQETLTLQLERVTFKSGLRAWVVSADSVKLIPRAHKVVAETPFETKLPQQLVTSQLFDTPVWRWIALLLMAIVIWFLARLAAWGVVTGLRPLFDAHGFRGPLRVALFVAGLRAALELAPPATLSRVFIERLLGLTLALAIAWAGAVLIDVIAHRWYSRLDPRVQAVSYSVLPLGRQVLKLALFLIAVLSVLGLWGYNTSTILAGLGVGGLAVALVDCLNH